MAFQLAEAFVLFSTRGAEAVTAQTKAVTASVTNLSTISSVPVANNTITSLTKSGTQLSQMVPMLAGQMTGLGGIGVMAFRAIQGAIASTAAALGVGTGGLFFIVLAIGAAVGALVKAFKSAFAVDEKAQATWEALKNVIDRILQIVGGPLVSAAMMIVGPALQILDAFTRWYDMLEPILGKLLDIYVVMNLMSGGLLGLLNTLTKLGEALGILRSVEDITAGGAKAGGGKAAFSGLEQFSKSLQQGIGGDEATKQAKKAAEALEDIQKNGVRIKNPQRQEARPAPAF